MKSVMSHSFAEVPRAEIQRSSFNRSHAHKTTFDADYLIPILVDDIIPGDTFNVRMDFFARLATPLHPIMDNMYLESFFFFVPYRLVWDNWEKMHGAQDDPSDSIDFTVPKYNSGTSVSLTHPTDLNDAFCDYLGLPYNGSVDLSEISVLPMRAYYLIWNEWFRDENLQDSLTVLTDDGPDNSVNYELQKRGKRHDYFTSCLPWPQKGDAVSLFGTAGTVNVQGPDGGGNDVTVLNSTGQTKLTSNTAYVGSSVVTGSAGNELYVDMSTSAATINDLRLAFQTQRLLERDARSGTRYNELILSHFGVTVPDFRLQRPEFLGGGSTPINVTPVANNTAIDSTADPASIDRFPGDLSGFGTVSGSHGFTKSFVEHGVLIGLVNVRADITYSQGLERYWTKDTRYDFYYPVLAQIGEQAVLNREIFYQNTSDDENVFGYQERYAEYRYKPSRVSRLFRPDNSNTLAAWHLSEDFASLPTLGATFIESNTGGPLDRAIAVPSQPHFVFDSYFNMKCARPMPLFGVPGNLDHF